MAKEITVSRVKSLLNERPEGMSYEDYKERLVAQRRWLKNRLRVFFVWKSKGILTKDRDGNYIPVESRGQFKGRVPGLRFVD